MPNEIIISREFPKKVIPLIKQAKQSIDIIVYDWGWYPDEIGEPIQIFNNAIYNANRKGVKVRAVVQKRLIYTILQKCNIETKILHSNKLLHIKLMIIDKKIAILGSHNYTKNAFNLNHEISIIIENTDSIEKLQNYFNNLFI
jgi:phosphatidylserine/phosphatidylglycerophosphate/cardiolipin synthase-like enzyme